MLREKSVKYGWVKTFSFMKKGRSRISPQLLLSAPAFYDQSSLYICMYVCTHYIRARFKCTIYAILAEYNWHIYVCSYMYDECVYATVLLRLPAIIRCAGKIYNAQRNPSGVINIKYVSTNSTKLYDGHSIYI